MPSLEARVRRLEARVRRVERIKAMRAKQSVFGFTQAQIDRGVAELREAGFTGEIEIQRIYIELVSPPPRDHDGNIIGPAPPSIIMEEDLWRQPTS